MRTRAHQAPDYSGRQRVFGGGAVENGKYTGEYRIRHVSCSRHVTQQHWICFLVSTFSPGNALNPNIAMPSDISIETLQKEFPHLFHNFCLGKYTNDSMIKCFLQSPRDGVVIWHNGTIERNCLLNRNILVVYYLETSTRNFSYVLGLHGFAIRLIIWFSGEDRLIDSCKYVYVSVLLFFGSIHSYHSEIYLLASALAITLVSDLVHSIRFSAERIWQCE
jgi:hypothetical protein